MHRGVVLLGLWLLLVACAAVYVYDRMEDQRRLRLQVAAMTGGDPDRGRVAIKLRSCGGCHQIPGVPGARGKVGPPLTAFAGRAIIAGRLPNTPDNLKLWVRDPHAVDPQTAMPATGVTPPEAADIAAYLYTLN
jgi:cytochrome c2